MNCPQRQAECRKFGELHELRFFAGKKEKRVKPEEDQNLGDNRTFIAIERSTKLVLNIAMGKRDQQTTDAFVEGIRHATGWSKLQITTDGFAAHRSAITTTLEDKITGYAQLTKAHCAPADVASLEVVPVTGQPDPERSCTSIVERDNLNVRMGVRRFTRLTNAFSKKWENHLGRQVSLE